MPLFFVRLIRVIGWIALAGSVGVVWSVTIWEAIHGPAAGQSVWPSSQMWRYYGTTLAIAGGVVFLTHAMALPIAFALVHSRSRWQRSLVAALACVPLLTMPNVFTYAWDLLMSTRIAGLRSVLEWTHWNAPGAAPFKAAWILAMWLWPVPVFVLAAAYRHGGRLTFQMASLDASPWRAFVRAVLPELRPAVIASAAIVFVLAVNDSTVCSLALATQTWAYEMMAGARLLTGGLLERSVDSDGRRAAFMFWRSWPMLATLGAVVGAALLSVRRVTHWMEHPATPDAGSGSSGGRWVARLGTALAVGAVLTPIAALAVELANRPARVEGLLLRAQPFGGAAVGTLVVAVLSGAAAIAIAVATFDGSFRGRPSRFGGAIVVLLLLTAVLPPELIGTGLVRIYADPRISPASSANLYDDTPLVWIAAMLARFGFVTACMGYLLTRRAGREGCAQAAVDGAGRIARVAAAQLPAVWPALVFTGVVVACLSISEVATSVLVQPIRFFAGSLAVAVDNQMHFGREDVVVLASLVLMLPAVLLAAAVFYRSARVSKTR